MLMNPQMACPETMKPLITDTLIDHMMLNQISRSIAAGMNLSMHALPSMADIHTITGNVLMVQMIGMPRSNMTHTDRQAMTVLPVGQSLTCLLVTHGTRCTPLVIIMTWQCKCLYDDTDCETCVVSLLNKLGCICRLPDPLWRSLFKAANWQHAKVVKLYVFAVAFCFEDGRNTSINILEGFALVLRVTEFVKKTPVEHYVQQSAEIGSRYLRSC